MKTACVLGAEHFLPHIRSSEPLFGYPTLMNIVRTDGFRDSLLSLPLEICVVI